MAEGDITGLIDTLEFDTQYGGVCDIIHVSGDVYAIAYRGPDLDGFLKTVTIDEYGKIGAVLDTLEFETDLLSTVTLAHISDDIYVIAYQGSGNDGWLRTVRIESTGNIVGIVNSFEIDGVYGRHFSIVHIAGDIYAFAYQGGPATNTGIIKTLPISNSGVIGAVIDNQDFDAWIGAFPDIIHIDGTVYAIAYSGGGPGADDGWVRTWSIANDGTIAGAQIAAHQYSTYCNEPKIRHISGNTYAIVYSGPPGAPSPDGYISTVSITVLGAIAGIATFEFDTTECLLPSRLISVSGDVYIVDYGRGGQGYLVTISITAAGAIGAVIDTFVFDAVCAYPELIHIIYANFAAVYSGPDMDGFVKTFDVDRRVVPTVQTLPATDIS